MLFAHWQVTVAVISGGMPCHGLSSRVLPEACAGSKMRQKKRMEKGRRTPRSGNGNGVGEQCQSGLCRLQKLQRTHLIRQAPATPRLAATGGPLRYLLTLNVLLNRTRPVVVYMCWRTIGCSARSTPCILPNARPLMRVFPRYLVSAFAC